MDDHINLYLVLVPALPLAAAILTGLFGPRFLRRHSHYLVIAAFAGSCISSLLLLAEVSRRQQIAGPSSVQPAGFEHIVNLWTWADVADAYDPVVQQPGAADNEGLRHFRIDIALRADALTAVMLLMVTFVSTLVAIFAAGYMHGDQAYWRFFCYIALFVFSMTMLVSVSNFVLLYVFWEAVGVCSYLLIGFWYEKPEAAAAGKKAFLVNRVGDFGFALALFLIWTTYGSLNFHDTVAAGAIDSTAASAVVQSLPAGANENLVQRGVMVQRGVLGKSRIATDDYRGGNVALAICLLLMLGACGKSAQLPLHVWLPDAMEGPTPVSALIHAATMVTAGVYMVARCTPLFMVSPEAQLVVACVGAGTALLAGLIALTQFDLKRVLAYSTISQLGYMFLGLGTGTFAGITAGMFHLFTHAFFKALLFLGAGSVMHAMGNVIDMRRFGGLRKVMPITHATFFIGCLALAGIPGLSGFWSKDAIVAAVHDKVHDLRHAREHGPTMDADGDAGNTQPPQSGHPAVLTLVALERGSHEPPGTSARSEAALERYAAIYQGLYWIAMFTAFLTVFYTFRAFFLTFYGEERIPPEAAGHAHESPAVMSWPLIVLAVFAALAGFVLDQTWQHQGSNQFAEFLALTPTFAEGAVAATKKPAEFHVVVAGTSGAIALGGLLITIYLYLGSHREIRWLKSLLDFEVLSRLLDGQSISRLGRLRWVVAVHRGAEAVGLGWLSHLIGRVVQLAVLVVAAPLLLGDFVSPYKLSKGKFFIDEIYHLVIVLPLRAVAAFCYALDHWVVDGLVNTVGRIPPHLGSLMRSLQMGLVQFYALAMLLGMLILIAARLIAAG